MSLSHQLLILAGAALCAAAPAARATSAAEECVRAGDAEGALAALQADAAEQDPVSAAYWKGRALTMLGRPQEAAECFQQVPKNHWLHPYAARGLIYCVWSCAELPFEQLLTPLTASPDAEVAAQALAALAERQMRYSDTAEPLAFTRLKEKARLDSSLEPIVKLLTLHLYRQQGDFDGGIEYGKNLEQDTALPLIMRQRVRLALAELYYAKEQAEDPLEQNADDGKGEETLLQFITANPESPLLDEAFRRLSNHTGANGSDYARAKLRDWAEDTAHPRRAALALYILHQMDQLHGNDPATPVNRAAAELPGEPTTRTILQEHIRKLLAQGKEEEASRYLNLLCALQKEPDARTQFLSALLPGGTQDEARSAMELFHRSAACADSALLTPALVNTLICAMRCGETQVAERLLAEPRDKHSKRALLLQHAAMLLETDPQRARSELEEARLLDPTPEQLTDIDLDLAQLTLAKAPADALRRLLEMPPASRRTWAEAQQLRYAALLEKAADAAPEEKQDACALLRSLYEQSNTLPLKQGLALHLADRLAADKRHREALQLLLELADQQNGGEQKAATLLYAGHEAAQLGTLEALEEAVALYEQSARQDSPLTPRAIIEQAAILVRINRTRDALALLHPLEQTERFNALTPPNQAHLLTVLADAHGLEMTPQSLATATTYSGRIATLPNLPPAWKVRGYLQHAALCTRMGNPSAACDAYLNALQMELRRADAQNPQSCQMLYYAASGAVYQLIQMEHFEQAADLADRTADWPGGSADAPAGPKSDAFRRWAQTIRQTHFLTKPMGIDDQRPPIAD